MVTPDDEKKIRAIVADALKPALAQIADLHDQWIGNEEKAADETLRQLLKSTERRTGEIVTDTRELTGKGKG